MRGLRVVALVALTLSTPVGAAECVPTVALGGPEGMAVRTLAGRAVAALQSPACLAVLPALGGPVVTPEEATAKLESLRFEDGTTGPAAGACRRGAFAATTVNGSVVWTCGGLRALGDRDPEMARAILIHELMHTLGLREAPSPGAPTSRAITGAVLEACR